MTKPTKPAAVRKSSRKRPPAPEPAPGAASDGIAPPSVASLIVGIGASAGGLEAFKRFFDHVPADSAMAFVLVQHLAPQHNSMLVDLLGRHTTMPVLEASDGARVEQGHVYVIPPDATLTIADGALQLSKPAPPRQYRWPIDTFFTSLAEDQGDCAVSIVLAGTGSDGARGLRAVKQHGGLTLAQAGFDHVAMSGMPASAAATGQVDEVLPVEAMPARLLAHQRHLHASHARKGPDGTRADLAEHLKAITGLLRTEVGHDFSQYKEKTLVRRIQRRMQVLQLATVPAYIAHLRQHPHESEALFRELLIGVTEFFRDPQAFAALQATAIPALLADRGAADTVRVWVPGCATGEEAYSIAIAFKEVMGEGRGAPKLQIFATDIDDAAIATARSGCFRKLQPGLSAERQERWFSDDGDNLRIVKSIRETCIFSPHSAIKDPPFSQLDLVSCRNLMIYMDPELQDRLVRSFHYALKPGGFLLLGPSEGLARNASLFSAIDKKHRLYARRNDVGATLPFVASNRSSGRTAPARAGTLPRPGAEDAIDRNARRVVEKYSPAYVVIDGNHDVLRFSGDTGRYLGPSSGTASLNLFALLHKGLRGAARAAVQQALAEHRTVVQDDLTVLVDGHRQPLRLIAEPLSDGASQLCVVAFSDVVERALPKDPAQAQGDAPADAGHLQRMEQELERTRVQLHSTIDQLETANEEMKSANEEYQSVNEELQSANEELETSKEEMQSINEELQTVNAELHSKNGALLHLNSDLQNLLESTQIATLFLDTHLHVTNFTPAMIELFHLRESDRGRPITDITARIPYPGLRTDVQQVLRTLMLVERELRSDTGAVFMLRIRPYRTVDNLIDGVVLTFVNITERKQHEFERGRLAAIVDSSKDAIIGHSLDGSITSWNAAAETMFGYPAARVLGRSLSLLQRAADGDHLAALLATCAQKEATAETRLDWERDDGSRIEVALTCSPVRDGNGKVVSGSTIARDVTDAARLQRELEDSRNQLDAVITQAAVGIVEADLDGRVLWANPRYCEIVGRSLQELLTLRVQDLTHADDRGAMAQELQALRAGGQPKSFDKRYVQPDDTVVWGNVNVSLRGNTSEQTQLGVVMDITRRKRDGEHLQLMLGELDHRVKNTLATVQSIAMQTLARAPDLDSFRVAFDARLLALSKTHNLLAAGAWAGARLGDIVASELAPYHRDDEDADAPPISIVGEDVLLSPKVAMALSMAIHELATNASKYGALSAPGGRVEVAWQVRPKGGHEHLKLQWTESGGPPVTPPARRGFGTRLITEGIAFELNGEAVIDYATSGVGCKIDVPLSEDAA